MKAKDFIGSGRPAGPLNGRDDVWISAAPADVPAHRFLHIGISRAARLLAQRHGRHDLAGGAVAALVTIAGDKRGLHGVEVAGLAEALDGCDFIALMSQSEAEAGV